MRRKKHDNRRRREIGRKVDKEESESEKTKITY